MPAGIAIGTAIAGVATASAAVYGAQKQSTTARKAGELTAASSREQLQYVKSEADKQAERDKAAVEEDKRRYEADTAERMREYEQNYALQRAAWDEGAGRRNLSNSAANTLSSLLHLPQRPQGQLAPSAPPRTGLPPGSTPPTYPAGAGSPAREVSGVAPSGQMNRMSDLMPAPTEALSEAPPWENTMQSLTTPYVYVRDASGRVTAVPKALARGARL